jgi:hypothetical protein
MTSLRVPYHDDDSEVRVKFPTDWPIEECYDFPWGELLGEADPFASFDYAPFSQVDP